MSRLLFIFLITELGLASQAGLFGVDASSASRAGSATADSQSAFQAVNNPALLAYDPLPQLGYTSSVVGAKTEAFSSVLLPKSFRSSAIDYPQAYQVPELSQYRWALGVTAPLKPKLQGRQIGFGLVVSGPYEKLRNFTAYAPGDFHSLRYGEADGQFKATLAAAYEILPGKFFLGGGVALFLNGLGSAETYLSTHPESRLNFDVTLQSAAVLGAYYRGLGGALGLTYREKIAPRFEQAIEARVPVLGTDDSAVFRQPAILHSTLYFEPATLEADYQWAGEKFSISLGLAWQIWSAYQPPILRTETENADGRRYETEVEAPALRNTLSPRVSLIKPLFSHSQLSVGYQFRPSPVVDTSGQANLLDAPSHIVGLGWEERFSPDLSATIFGQYHFWNSRQVTKITRESVTGSPGYLLEGHAYTLGLALKIAL